MAVRLRTREIEASVWSIETFSVGKTHCFIVSTTEIVITTGDASCPAHKYPQYIVRHRSVLPRSTRERTDNTRALP